jgi:RNA 3'-terminal phosphate cyclase (ATP)
MLTIDGSQGEGGGQVLRTSLALSMVTGTPFRIDHIRARRPRPGLQRQHLTCVEAAAEVSRARTTGAALGSRHLTFEPGNLAAGEYNFKVGTAGSAILVLQTVLPPLLLADGPSRVTISGGTHNIAAPPFDFLQASFLPLVGRMGPRVTATLVRHGFYPAGGGKLTVEIEPVRRMTPLDLLDRGPIARQSATALIARLPRHVAERELGVVGESLGWTDDRLHIREISDSKGPGNALLIEIAAEHVTEVFTAFGERGRPAERVAAAAVEEAQAYLAADAPVGPHLADQLLLPMALARGGSIRALPLTLHSRTNMDVIGRFLDVRFEVEEDDGRGTVVRVVRA